MSARVACKCCNQVSHGHLMDTCSVCKYKFKHTCVDITANEVRTLNMNKYYDCTCIGCRAIGKDLKDLKSLIKQLQQEIKALKDEKNQHTKSSEFNFEDVMYEMSERQKRRNNIMIFNVPEP
ncbi:unnamed protein product [Psylliodes chrysocephalus]|uniref:Uncharacterized protein n=1 Tax=Psylliodes chrysocephalus TaxID=3402493 RepID=A0A9P0CPD7_9CUCU|nr:unnamed protein product [Psylliodes chrysocephala]